MLTKSPVSSIIQNVPAFLASCNVQCVFAIVFSSHVFSSGIFTVSFLKIPFQKRNMLVKEMAQNVKILTFKPDDFIYVSGPT